MRFEAKEAEAELGLAPALRRLLEEVAGSLGSEASLDRRFWDDALLDPARDIVSRSGKGFRARLVDHAWRLAGGAPDGPSELLPLTIELLHTGSLIVDDIEDDSRMRRGRPALHREYGVPVALNTGNWFYFLATDLVRRLELPPESRLALHEDLAASLLSCHEGQALDLSIRVASQRRTEVPALVATTTRKKTGALMWLAGRFGARGAGSGGAVLDAISDFGTELGVGLQMLDDWSGVCVDARREKGIEDIKLGRPTWPWAWLAESGPELTYAETARQARDLTLDWEADQILKRFRAQLADIAPARIRAQLDRAMSALTDSLGETRAVTAVRHDIEELERGFGLRSPG